MKTQNYSNHSRLTPGFHGVLAILILLAIGGSIYKFYKNYSTGYGGGILFPAILIIISLALFLTAMFARTFALKAQDRAIRAEENLRYFAMTGNLLDPALHIAQIVALRFASNHEFVDLAHKAVQENLSSKQIKQQITSWREDNYRV